MSRIEYIVKALVELSILSCIAHNCVTNREQNLKVNETINTIEGQQKTFYGSLEKMNGILETQQVNIEAQRERLDGQGNDIEAQGKAVMFLFELITKDKETI